MTWILRILCELKLWGCGIPEDKLPYILERFVQADSTAQINVYGSRIWLTWVNELINLYNGKIHTEKAVGIGSCSTFVLPIHSELVVPIKFEPDYVVDIEVKNANKYYKKDE